MRVEIGQVGVAFFGTVTIFCDQKKTGGQLCVLDDEVETLKTTDKWKRTADGFSCGGVRPTAPEKPPGRAGFAFIIAT